MISFSEVSTHNVLNNKEVSNILYDKGIELLFQEVTEDLKNSGDVPHSVEASEVLAHKKAFMWRTSVFIEIFLCFNIPVAMITKTL